MEYTVKKLAGLSGVSSRTLRYYDEIGLLKPARVTTAGYRIYGAAEVNALQQILFYRELGFALEDIQKLMQTPGYSPAAALENHLHALFEKREQLNALIANVEKSIRAGKGECSMSDKEKFEGFKKKLIDENEEKYGKEVREKYGDDVADASNARFAGMTQEQYAAAEELSARLNDTLKQAAEEGDPAGETAQKASALHKEWLCLYWPEGHYTKEAHKGLCQMYLDDERFKAYYDKIHPNAAQLLRDAVELYCTD